MRQKSRKGLLAAHMRLLRPMNEVSLRDEVRREDIFTQLREQTIPEKIKDYASGSNMFQKCPLHRFLFYNPPTNETLDAQENGGMVSFSV
jgi:hypothetical protein